jgi:hypothetical protein
MALSKNAVLVLASIVIGLVIILFSAPDYEPYYKNIPYAKYEGFNVFGESSSESSGNSRSESESVQGFETLHPAYVTGEGGVFSDGVNSVFTNQPSNRVVYGANVGDSEHLDHFLDVKTTGVDGKNGCQSSGLSNSLGALCLTPDLIQQLRTRGGNA